MDNAVFSGCSFDNNVGGPCIASNPVSTGLVALNHCTGTADTGGTEAARVLLMFPRNLEITGGYWFNIALGVAYGQIEATAAAVTGFCVGAHFVGDYEGFRGAIMDGWTGGPRFNMSDCTFEFTSTTASSVMPGASQMILTGSNIKFHDNRIIVAETLYDSGGGATNPFFSMTYGTALNNRWETDMSGPATSSRSTTTQAGRATRCSPVTSISGTSGRNISTARRPGTRRALPMGTG